jgi:hypothetical protein
MSPREARERELKAQMQTADGKYAIESKYKRLRGIPEGSTVPVGTLFGEMIETILDAEFAKGA